MIERLFIETSKQPRRDDMKTQNHTSVTAVTYYHALQKPISGVPIEEGCNIYRWLTEAVIHPS
jgi:hypothetical protein